MSPSEEKLRIIELKRRKLGKIEDTKRFVLRKSYVSFLLKLPRQKPSEE